MPNTPAAPLGPNGECDTCGQPHLRNGKVTCRGHVVTDRDGYVPGQPRPRLDHPKPCRLFPRTGLPTCASHGSSTDKAPAAGQQRDAEDRATKAVLKKLGAAGEPVNDPIAKLCAIAGRAVSLMEGLGDRIDDLAGDDRDQARADIVVYGRAIKDAASVVESIIRMGIAERLAKQDADRTASIVAFIDGVLAELGHNPRDPEVAGVVVRMLQRAS